MRKRASRATEGAGVWLTKKRLFWVVGSQVWQLDASYTFDAEGRPATLT
jgi:hypothetical protein